MMSFPLSTYEIMYVECRAMRAARVMFCSVDGECAVSYNTMQHDIIWDRSWDKALWLCD